MATIKVYDGETLVKEIQTDLNVDDIVARMEVQPHEINLSVDGHPVVLEVLVHPTMKETIDAVLAKARKKADDEVKDEDEDDERFKRLLALLEEEEGEDESDEEEAKTARTINELVKAVKELRETVAKLQAGEPKTEEVKKERAKQPIILKSYAPYERAQKFEQPKDAGLEKVQTGATDPEALSDFQRELFKRLRILP